MQKVTPHLFINKKSEVEATIEIIGDIGYNFWADTYEDYKANTSENMANEIKAIQNVKANTINVVLESLGGDLSHALAIHSILKNSGSKIKTYLRGANASSSTIIASAASGADNIYMANTGLYLIHKPMNAIHGNANDFEQNIEDLKKWQSALEKSYLDLGVSQEDLNILMEKNGGHGEWLTFDEAKEYGFVGNQWKSESVVNYKPQLFKNKKLLTPKNIKMENNKVKEENKIDEKGLISKIKEILNISPENKEVKKPKVKNELTEEEQTSVVDEVMQILEPRIAALEEALVEMQPAEEEEMEEEVEDKEKEYEDKIENLKKEIESKNKEIENLKKDDAKKTASPKPKAENKIDANTPAWKVLADAHKIFHKN